MFLIAFNETNYTLYKDTIHFYIKNVCNSWWHFIEHTYIVNPKEKYSIKELTEGLRGVTCENLKFIIIEVNIKNYNGFLEQQAYDWLRDKKSFNKSIKKKWKTKKIHT